MAEVFTQSRHFASQRDWGQAKTPRTLPENKMDAVHCSTETHQTIRRSGGAVVERRVVWATAVRVGRRRQDPATPDGGLAEGKWRVRAGSGRRNDDCEGRVCEVGRARVGGRGRVSTVEEVWHKEAARGSAWGKQRGKASSP
jgi:hypothetical protein